jgi:hypothetical protein
LCAFYSPEIPNSIRIDLEAVPKKNDGRDFQNVKNDDSRTADEARRPVKAEMLLDTAIISNRVVEENFVVLARCSSIFVLHLSRSLN